MNYFVEILVDSGQWEWLDCSIFTDLSKARACAKAWYLKHSGQVRIMGSDDREYPVG